MKRYATAMAVVGAFLVAAPAAAQTFGFGAHAGVSLPMGDYGATDNLETDGFAKTGFSAGLDLRYPLLMVTPGLNWYTSADVIAHSVDEDEAGIEFDGGYLYVPLMTGLLFEFPAGGFSPFLNAQGGLVLHKGPSLDDPFLGTGESQWGTNFGFVIGGGARFGQNFYAGLKYYPLSLDPEYEESIEPQEDVETNFLDIYVGFGVF